MRFSNNAKSSKQMDNGDLTALISQLWFSKQFPAKSKTIQTYRDNSGWWQFTWVGRRVVCRRHVRQESAASLGLGSGSGGTRGQRTRENLFHWPEGKSRESQTSTPRSQMKKLARNVWQTVRGILILNSEIEMFLYRKSPEFWPLQNVLHNWFNLFLTAPLIIFKPKCTLWSFCKQTKV